MSIKTIPEIKLVRVKTNIEGVKIASSIDTNYLVRQFFSDDISLYESCFLVLLNRANTTIGFVKISQGGVTGTVVDPILISKYAIESLAKGVILCHNHPSGNLNPSESDKKLTEKVKNGLKMFDVTLLDHIIITEAHYYSFADEGIL